MSTISKQGRLSTEELYELKWLMGGVLCLLSLWSLTALDFSGGLVVVVAAAMVLASLIKPKLILRIPDSTWRIAAPVLLVFVGIDFALNLPNFLPPLIRMVMFLLLFRALAQRQQREDLQLVLLCLFCLVISGALTVSLLFALQILLFAPLAMALLFVVCVLDRGPNTAHFQPSWDNFRWWQLMRRVWAVLDVRVLILGALMFGAMVTVSSLLFVLMPRFNLHQAIPFLDISTEPQSGFSDSVGLNDITEIRENDSVALRIDVPSLEAIETTPYWRISILDGYSNGNFRRSPALEGDDYMKDDRVRLIDGRVQRRGASSDDTWTFYLEGGISQYLPVPGAFDEMRFAALQDVRYSKAHTRINMFGLDSVKQSVFAYQLTELEWSHRQPGSKKEAALARSGVDPSASTSSYPNSLLELNIRPKEVKQLGEINAEVLGDSSSVDAPEYSQLATEYLRSRFRYSLKPNIGTGDGDPVIRWLVNGNQGHCELFAGAFIFMAREAGFPARMAVGFSGGAWNSVEEYFLVRNRDAHAWVEIFDATTNEWLRVDPTPGAGASDPEVAVRGGVDFVVGWGAWLDSLRIQWYRRIVNFDQDDQIEMASTLAEVAKEYWEHFRLRSEAWMADLEDWLAAPFSQDRVLQAACFVIACILLYAVWWTRYAWLGFWHQWRNRPEALSPVRRQAGKYLSRLKRKLSSVEQGAGEGTASAVRAELEAIRFGPQIEISQAKAAFSRARQTIRSL